MSSSNELTNISYTNKDFNSIYAELIEYARMISSKWNPADSEESDPGVVLLKLAAIIGDKNNYNIDKNMLELMPASVTQLPNARSVFHQCGYTMKHYHSAEGTVNLTLIKDIKEDADVDIKNYYHLPMFTMFTNDDSSIVYTSVEDSDWFYDADKKVTRKTVTIPVMQGIVNRLEINGSDVITLENLDSNNRLYLPSIDIAENGIFINNVSDSNYDDWKKVNVLDIQEPSEKCYRFGITNDGANCYIEFPSNINLFIGSGINITYLTTMGSQGVISYRQLTKFYGENKFTPYTTSDDTPEVSATTDIVKITNEYGTLGGSNPETIDEAYMSYQRIKNTFDTLVSTKDYANYMISSKSASNGYVCDRTDDIQRIHKILVNYSNSYALKSHVTDTTNYNMTAYDLCVYGLTYVADSNIKSLENYNKTFTLISDDKFVDKLESEDIKCIAHDFKEFETNKILMLKNKYPIRAQIITKLKLTAQQYTEVLTNIRSSLFIALNSKEMLFGEGVDYDIMYNAILTADDRIKAVSLEYPTYETYVIYTDGISFKELRVDSDSLGGYAPANDTSEVTSLYYYDTATKKMVQESAWKSGRSYYTFNQDLENLWNSFRAEIFAKNVLIGTTPLYNKDNRFVYSLNQTDTTMYGNIQNITSVATINPDVDKSYTVSKNENILITTPTLIKESEYSSYVKFQYKLSRAVSQNSDYMLENDDYIIFFWKAKSEDEYYTYIKYSGNDGNSPANYICPSVSLLETNIKAGISSDFDGLPDGKHTLQSLSTLNEYVTELAGSTYVLSGLNKITTKKINTIHLNNDEDGASFAYWITNDREGDEEGTVTCKLNFDSKGTYILDKEEYFIYTNADKTALYVLGQGTRLEKQKNFTFSSDSCELVDYISLLQYGPDAIDNWVTFNSVSSTDKTSLQKFYATEMTQTLVGEGATVYLEGDDLDLDPLNSTFSSPIESNIRITFADESEDLILPKTSEGYQLKTLLRIRTGPTTPQTLLTNQTVTLSGNNTSRNLSNTTILSSREIDMSGATSYDVTKIGGITSLSTVDILSYSYANSDADFSLSCDVTPSDNVAYIENIQLIPGSYLLELQYNDKEINRSKSSGPYVTKYTGKTPSGGTNLTSISDANKIFKLNVSSTSSFNIAIRCSLVKDVTKSSITIKPLYRYDIENLKIPTKSSHDATSTNSEFETNVLSSIKNMDPDCVFDYMSDAASDCITNPLESNSFFYKNHYYNKFTIGQWDVLSDNTNINLLTNVR